MGKSTKQGDEIKGRKVADNHMYISDYSILQRMGGILFLKDRNPSVTTR